MLTIHLMIRFHFHYMYWSPYKQDKCLGIEEKTESVNGFCEYKIGERGMECMGERSVSIFDNPEINPQSSPNPNLIGIHFGMINMKSKPV